MRTGKLLLCGFVVFLLVSVVPAAAYAVFANENADNDNRPTMLVEYGTGKDVGLVKVTHIHYAKSVDKARPAKTTTCYKLAGWKWAVPVTYTITQDTELIDAITQSAETWDAVVTGRELFTNPDKGDYPWGGPSDGFNSIGYGDYPTDGVIAVTSTWYSRATKTAVESDILFDTDFTWGDAMTDTETDPVMDLQNIATHEIGHTLGLSDLYTGSCSAATMYGYSYNGDTEKRSLELPDITGLTKLYGA